MQGRHQFHGPIEPHQQLQPASASKRQGFLEETQGTRTTNPKHAREPERRIPKVEERRPDHEPNCRHLKGTEGETSDDAHRALPKQQAQFDESDPREILLKRQDEQRPGSIFQATVQNDSGSLHRLVQQMENPSGAEGHGDLQERKQIRKESINPNSQQHQTVQLKYHYLE